MHDGAQGHELVSCLVNVDPRHLASVLHLDRHLVESYSILWISLEPTSNGMRHAVALARRQAENLLVETVLAHVQRLLNLYWVPFQIWSRLSVEDADRPLWRSLIRRDCHQPHEVLSFFRDSFCVEFLVCV
jgi:hypothetical protein